MPLTQISAQSQIAWTLNNTTGLFGPVINGLQTNFFNLGGISLTNWNQLFASEYVVFPTATTPSGLAAVLVSGGSLTASTTYYYKITATGIQGTSSVETSPSSEVSATPSGGNLSVKLTWTALTGATGYNIYRGTSTGAENLLVGTIATAVTPATTFTDTGFAGTSQSPPGAGPNNYIEFSIQTFTNLVNESVTFAHALTLMVLPASTSGSSATCVFAPGTTNGLTWFFGGTNPTITVPIGGVFFFSLPSSTAPASGQAIGSSSKTFRITNNGSGSTGVLDVDVMVIGSTT